MNPSDTPSLKPTQEILLDLLDPSSSNQNATEPPDPGELNNTLYIASSREKGNVHECPINLQSLFVVSHGRGGTEEDYVRVSN